MDAQAFPEPGRLPADLRDGSAGGGGVQDQEAASGHDVGASRDRARSKVTPLRNSARDAGVNMIDPAEILGPSGRIAARLAGYEERPQQLAMARAVAAAIEGRRHLIVEAGTGVGKSFAYL